MGETKKHNDAADALESLQSIASRRAERNSPPSPEPSPSGAAACLYFKDRVCNCNGRGFCLEAA